MIVARAQFFPELHWTTTCSPSCALRGLHLSAWLLDFLTILVRLRTSEVVDASLVDGFGRISSYSAFFCRCPARPVAAAIVAFFGSWNDLSFAAAFFHHESVHVPRRLGISTSSPTSQSL